MGLFSSKNNLITHAADFFGGVSDAYTNARMASTWNFNANEAQKNRDWQEYMSNTSYQRAVNDLTAAGLNPALAYSQGGASTPGGSTASGSAGEDFISSASKLAISAIGGLGNAISAKAASLSAASVAREKMNLLNSKIQSNNYTNSLKKQSNHINAARYLAQYGNKEVRLSGIAGLLENLY